jgi:hypothetical protein
MPASAPLKTTAKTVELTRIEFMAFCAFSGLDQLAYGICQSAAAVNKSVRCPSWLAGNAILI